MQTGQCDDAQRSFDEALDHIHRLILIGGCLDSCTLACRFCVLSGVGDLPLF